jgi:hypothetical protein
LSSSLTSKFGGSVKFCPSVIIKRLSSVFCKYIFRKKTENK